MLYSSNIFHYFDLFPLLVKHKEITESFGNIILYHQMYLNFIQTSHYVMIIRLLCLENSAKQKTWDFLMMQKDMLLERTCWSNYYLKESNIPFFSMLQQSSQEDELSYTAGLAFNIKAHTEESKERERKKYTNISSKPFCRLSFHFKLYLYIFEKCFIHALLTSLLVKNLIAYPLKMINYVD